MNTHPTSWLDRLLGATLVLAVSALLLRWAWDIIRPLLPVIVVVALVMVALGIVARAWRNRY